MNFKEDRITLLRELLVTQMNHWMLFPFYVMILTIIGDVTGMGHPRVLFWLALGCLPFILYFIRRLVPKFWALFLLHIPFVIFLFVLPAEHLSIRIFHTLIGFIYAIYSTYLWIATAHKKDSKLYPILGVGLSVVMLLIVNNQGHTEWETPFITILIITLGLYFIIYYIEQYQTFLTVNQSSAGHIPAREMFQSGMGLVVTYTGIGLLLLIVISNFDWLKGVFRWFKGLFAGFLNLFFSLFPKNTNSSASKVEETPVKQETVFMLPGEEVETYWIWNVVDYVVEIAFLILILFVLFKLGVFFVKFVKSKMNHSRIRRQSVSETESVVDVREKCDIIRNAERKTHLPFLHLNPKERIRQLYKKKVLASRTSFAVGSSDTSSLNRYTARESAKILDRTDFALIYEKARYSDQECGNDDVKTMKNACK